MAIIRVYAGMDGKSHFEEITPKLEPRGDKSASAELIPGSGIIIRRFEPDRSNPWHQERIAAFREAGVTDLNITPVSEDPAATVAQVREWVS